MRSEWRGRAGADSTIIGIWQLRLKYASFRCHEVSTTTGCGWVICTLADQPLTATSTHPLSRGGTDLMTQRCSKFETRPFGYKTTNSKVNGWEPTSSNQQTCWSTKSTFSRYAPLCCGTGVRNFKRTVSPGATACGRGGSPGTSLTREFHSLKTFTAGITVPNCACRPASQSVLPSFVIANSNFRASPVATRA